eukprot:CAMPEP_0173171804 /NCGR_PEP_ID=MMETSP1141-20130122/1960_1 /TAXON_ID=483371 /ORGANISM="non described non described, Strain CCMP2298" /LENGTH=226 /DNA_ID=CAMNT_0014093777 /DNA_START=196 /DNA_END=877 /DNA_ORIENTATION=+
MAPPPTSEVGISPTSIAATFTTFLAPSCRAVASAVPEVSLVDSATALSEVLYTLGSSLKYWMSVRVSSMSCVGCWALLTVFEAFASVSVCACGILSRTETLPTCTCSRATTTSTQFAIKLRPFCPSSEVLGAGTGAERGVGAGASEGVGESGARSLGASSTVTQSITKRQLSVSNGGRICAPAAPTRAGNFEELLVEHVHLQSDVAQLHHAVSGHHFELVDQQLVL